MVMTSSTKESKRVEKCALCLQDIDGKPFYIDKYPHHENCKAKVLEYLKTKGNSG